MFWKHTWKNEIVSLCDDFKRNSSDEKTIFFVLLSKNNYSTQNAMKLSSLESIYWMLTNFWSTYAHKTQSNKQTNKQTKGKFHNGLIQMEISSVHHNSGCRMLISLSNILRTRGFIQVSFCVRYVATQEENRLTYIATSASEYIWT
jgi:hypothetical protein